MLEQSEGFCSAQHEEDDGGSDVTHKCRRRLETMANKGCEYVVSDEASRPASRLVPHCSCRSKLSSLESQAIRTPSSNNGAHRKEEGDGWLSAAFLSLFSHWNKGPFSLNVPTSFKSACPSLYIWEPPRVLCPKSIRNIPFTWECCQLPQTGSRVGVGCTLSLSCPFLHFCLLVRPDFVQNASASASSHFPSQEFYSFFSSLTLP
ncbi:hypothetical protein V6N12_028824 [Hibiscus sabdariffa]|uniref:Uncharacterized protein n=1 Tax=Hibiscus sabdariffa TaxID=183260 RepID=A0ABR2F6X6_9ROSI